MKNDRIRLGCCLQRAGGADQSPLDRLVSGVRLITDAGFDYVEATVDTAMRLDEGTLRDARSRGIRIGHFNCFIPGSYRILADDAQFNAALEHVKIAAERTAMLGAEIIVLGSGAARRKPEGMAQEKAMDKFAYFCEKAAIILSGYNITLALEPLHTGETDIVNTLAEGAAVVKRVAMPNFKLLCDSFHMHRAGESPEGAAKYAGLIAHAHIAEPPERVYPGKNGGAYLRAFASALRGAGYTGGVTAECGFGGDLRAELAASRAFMGEIFGV